MNFFIDDDVVSRTALATLRRHAFSPLTGTPPFWERLVRTVLESREARAIEGEPSPEQVAAVATAVAPGFASSPITNSDRLFRAIVATVLSEHRSPSGLGERIPRRLPIPRPVGSDADAARP